MTIDLAERVLDNWTPAYVAPMPDKEFGAELFRLGYGRQVCRNEAQRHGYDKAARRLLMQEWFEADVGALGSATTPDHQIRGAHGTRTRR